MYEVPQGEERPGCRDAWVVTVAAFAVVLPIVIVCIGLLSALTAAVVLFTVHPALSLIPVVVAAGGVYLFARWEQGRFRPPDL